MGAAVNAGLAAPGTRRYRTVDFWRGVALFVIFLNHLPENPGRWLTWSHWGLGPTTAVFFFLSGFVAQHVYAERWRREGGWSCLRHAALRALKLHAWNMGLVCFAIAVAVIADRVHGAPPIFWPDKEVMQRFAAAHPLAAAGEALRMNFQPIYADILPAYIVLILMLVPMQAVIRFSPPLFFGVSVGLWAASQFWREFNLPALGLESGWQFNPFAWQLVFFAGVAACRWREKLVAARGWRGGMLAGAAGGLLLLIAIVRNAWALPAPWSDWIGLMRPLANWGASIGCLANSALLIFVGAWLTRKVGDRPGAGFRFFEAAGQNSLPVFVVTSALVHLCALLRGSTEALGRLESMPVMGAGILAVWLIVRVRRTRGSDTRSSAVAVA
jgi:hypothetical protein